MMPSMPISSLFFAVDSNLSNTPHPYFLCHHHFFLFLVLQSPISFPTLYPQGVSITRHRPSVTTHIPSTTPPISSISVPSFHLKLYPSRHHLHALQIFNACKLFSPNLYPANDDERTHITKEWLERLFVKFQTSEEEQDRCRGECLEMVETMREIIPNKSLFEAWEFASTTPERPINWHGLSNLWRRVMVIPVSTAICERGFSKQNPIKIHLRTSLKLETLNALMCIV
jgi:hypothetical protein